MIVWCGMPPKVANSPSNPSTFYLPLLQEEFMGYLGGEIFCLGSFLEEFSRPISLKGGKELCPINVICVKEMENLAYYLLLRYPKQIYAMTANFSLFDVTLGYAFN